MLLGGDDSSASKAEVNDGGLGAERISADERHLDSPGTATDSTTLAPPSNLDEWHDIDDFPEPLHHHTSAAGQCTVRARSEATMCSSARPRSEPLNHLTNRSAADENELVRPALNSDIFDEEERQRQEQEDWGYDNDNDIKDGRQLQQEVKEDVTATLTSEKVGDTFLSSKDESLRLATHDPSPEPSQDKLGSYSSNFSDDKLDSNPVSINVDREPRPA